MTKEYKWWKCTDPNCGMEVMSIEYPTGLPWSDGHKCRYRDATAELEKEMPDYAKDMKNIIKGEK